MNKRILTVAVAALALAACSKNETVEVAKTSEIGFAGVGINNITRAGDVSSTNFSEFYVFGAYNSEAKIFDNQLVNGGPNAWTYSPLQYWVANETYNFGAYAPKADGVVAAWTYSGGLTLEVNSDNDNQNDVVRASNNGTMYADVTMAQPVALSFEHILSKIKFVLTKGTSVQGQKVEVSGFSLSGEMVTSATWTDAMAPEPVAQTSYTGFGTATEVAAAGVELPFYVIPQTVGAWSISFTAKVTDNAGTVLKEGTVTATLPTTITPWVAGNAYQYTAAIEMNNIDDEDTPDEEIVPIEFTGSKAADWVENDANNSDITPEVNQ